MEKIKIHLAFIGILLAIAFPVELLTAKPGPFAIFLYVVLGAVGSIVYLNVTSSAKKLGIISLIAGFALEFTIMRPDWVLHILGVQSLPEGRTAVFPVIVNIVYWFSIWAVPAYVLNWMKFKQP